ncbi:MAG: hypothetical protein IT200_02815 [Thermoleophilia bacterium]|nr:hypothetical protein [Thermoleophilia bacterium]
MRAIPGHGWLRRVGPWVGIGTSPAALMAGGGVAEGVEGGVLVAAVLAGVAALTTLAVGQGVLGQRLRLPLGGVVAGPLGVEGSRRIASLAMLVMMIGWFGVNVGVAGTATGRLLGIPDVAGMVLFAFLALAMTWRGIGSLSWAALAAGVATVTLAAWGMHLASGAHGLTLESAHTATDPISPVEAASLMVGYGAAFALRTPDFTIDLERRRQVLWCGLAGLAAPLTAFALAGATLQAATGTWDLADVMRALGSSTAAYLFIAVGFFGSVMSNLFSGSLALQGAVPVEHRRGMLVVLGIGLVLAASGFSDRMPAYLVAMAILAPGLAVLCWWAWPRLVAPPRGWVRYGLAAWGASVIVGMALSLSGSGSGALAAVLVTGFAGLRWLPGVRQTPGSRQ